MKNPASSLNNKNKFLIFGCGFSGSFFAKKIRQLGYTALTSSRSEKKDPDSFLFNSEIGIIPTKKTFDGVTHILSCIPPDKDGKDRSFPSLSGGMQLRICVTPSKVFLVGIIPISLLNRKLSGSFFSDLELVKAV